MAFPAVTPTSAPQASSLHSNNAANAGLTNAIPVDRLTSLEQTVGNLLTDLPGAINALVTTGTLGYGTGAGGTVTQATSKSTGVTLNKATGTITMNAASLATVTTVGFTLTNSAIAATDVVLVSIKSGATASSYSVQVGAVAAGSCVIELRNYTGGTLSEAVVLSFAVIKGVAA